MVGSKQFGQIFKTALPGNWLGKPEQVFSQPLVYTPKSGTKQYVYWATTQNNIYKMDAKTGEIVLSRNLHIPFNADDLDGCVDISPFIGVTATGVIDPDTETLYLTAKTYLNQNGGTAAQGRDNGRYYVHAIDVNTLEEKPNFPVDLQGTMASNSNVRMFTGGIHHQRPGLLQAGNFIYAGFASHCVQYNFTGWIIGWDKTTGKIVERFATEGDGVPNNVKGGGVWMSGGGLTSDDKGSIWFGSGNGYASQLSTIPVKGSSPPTSLEEAAVHMTQNDDGSLNLVDFFMPWEKQALDGADKDLGTTPLELLPSQFACGDIQRIGVITGKSGKTYWLNMDNLGGYRNAAGGTDDDIIQVFQNDNSVYAGAGVYPLEGGYIYINVIQHPTNVFKFACNNGKPSFTKVAESPENNAYILGVGHGTTTTLDGQEGTGLFWVTDVQGSNLKIFNAVPQNGKLTQINSFSINGVTKFTRPVFGDGLVYIGTTQGAVYAFGSPVNEALNCTTPVKFNNTNINSTSAAQTVTCKANIGATVTDIGLDDNANFQISGLPQLPVQMKAGDSFSIQATFKPSAVGLLSANINFNTTNSVDKYSTASHSRLTGTGQSQAPILDISTNTVTFNGVVTGEKTPDKTFDLSNLGTSVLTMQSVQYSTSNSSGPYQTWNGQGDLVAGPFTLTGIPSTIAGQQGVTTTIKFDSTNSGTFSLFLKFVSDGGTKSVSVAATAGPAATALLEFQTPDGTGWVTYDQTKPFTLGNVTENTSRSLKFRISNTAAKDGVNLKLTVSKPPYGIPGIVRAASHDDLAEGTEIAPGQSATAAIVCSVPKSQWNIDAYNGTAPWTLNTNDAKLGKQVIQFLCNAVSEQAAPLGSDGQSKYRYLGCYKENNPGRQLSNQLYGDDNSTIPKCVAACAAKNYVYCGAQYHRECWGGNTIPNQKVDDANCNFDCSGNLNQICGGNGFNDQNNGAYISLFGNSDGGGDPPPPAGGPYVNPGVGGYGSIGCYTEATNGRALPNGVATTKKTVGQCVTACSAQNYKYAGVEYGGECWCGNAFTAGAVQAKIGDCNMPCNDNGTEYCGGPSRLNVYQKGGSASTTTTTLPTTPTTTPGTPGNTTTPVSPVNPSTTTTTTTTSSPTATPTGPSRKPVVSTNWQYQGCWTEATNSRALTGKTFANDTMTLESCAKFCDTFTYFGVEYGRECYCGNSLQTGSVNATIADCSFLCPGDKTEYCGAGNRLELYKYQAAPNPKPSTATPSPSTPGTPTPSGTPPGNSNVEKPSSSSSAPPSSTPSASTPSATPTPSTSSATPTSSSTSAKPTPTGPSIYPGNANFTYYHCVSEPSSGRLLVNQVLNDNKNMTIENCLQKCTQASTPKLKYSWAGVEYGQECWCGDKLRLDGGQAAKTPGKNITDSECNFLCPGNKTSYCGAGVKMSVYVLKELVQAQAAKQQ